MATARAREPGTAAWVLLLPLVLAGCASSGGGFFGTSEPSPPPSPAFAPPPPNMNVVDFVGRWGYAAFGGISGSAVADSAAIGSAATSKSRHAANATTPTRSDADPPAA